MPQSDVVVTARPFHSRGGQVLGAEASSVIKIQSTGGGHAELKALVKLSRGY